MERACLVGTANTWKLTPWHDKTARICTLNDAYANGFPRIDEHYEIHPFDQMWFRPVNKREFQPGEIPPGAYVRPEGHLDWLKARAVEGTRVWLKDAPPEGWPATAQRFPLEDLEATYGAMWTSGPSYMVMHLYDRGIRDIAIYGIHLETESEYIRQMGGFSFLLGRILGAKARVVEAGGMRIYEGESATVRLPLESPVLRQDWKYGYERKPPPVDVEAQLRFRAAQQAQMALANELIRWPAWKVWGRRAKLVELSRTQAAIKDAELEITSRRSQQQMQRSLRWQQQRGEVSHAV